VTAYNLTLEKYSEGVKTIADHHGIPQRFLVQILLQLKGAGYVTSIRGAAGGSTVPTAGGSSDAAECHERAQAE